MRKQHLFPLLALLLAFPINPGKSKLSYDLDAEAVALQSGGWMSKTEVSNARYKEFLMGLIERGDAHLVPQYAPDFSVWETPETFATPYKEYYFSHPAFMEYPVVGISYEAATEFCKWMTDKLAGKVGRKKEKDVQKLYRFRLPTEAEWMDAASGNAPNGAWYAGCYTYPRAHNGYFNFNHKLGKGDYAGYVGGHPKDYEGYMITAPVKSFHSEKTGLYNPAGNVAEMVQEEGIAKGGSWMHEAAACRVESQLEYDKPTSWLGFRFVIEVDDAAVSAAGN